MNRRSGQRGKGVGDLLGSIVKTYFTEQEFPGERHGVLRTPDGREVRANFMGPGTRLDIRIPRGDKPVDDVDAAAMKHDLSYQAAGELLRRSGNRNAFKQAIWTADKEFIQEASASKDDPNMGKVASTFMSLKMGAEKLGVLPTKVFSGGKNDPAARLRAIAKEQAKSKPMEQQSIHAAPANSLRSQALHASSLHSQEGGLAPVAAVLIPIIATLGSEAVSYLFKKVTGSGMIGGSINGLSTEDKREALIQMVEEAS